MALSKGSLPLVVAGVLCWALLSAAESQQRDLPPPGVAADSSSSRIVSPTVVATVMVRTLNGENSLSLLVLWRGGLGWFLKDGPRGSGGGMRQGSAAARVQYGGLNLTAELRLTPRTVVIQGANGPLDPGDANVILVDKVDGALKVVATLKIDPSMATNKQLEPVLKRSPQIVDFLQCDQKLSDPMVQSTVVDPICRAVTSK